MIVRWTRNVYQTPNKKVNDIQVPAIKPFLTNRIVLAPLNLRIQQFFLHFVDDVPNQNSSASISGV